MNIKQITTTFPSQSTWYYIDATGTINSFITHGGLSPLSASILAKVFNVHKTWEEANKALTEYNKVFTTFKD